MKQLEATLIIVMISFTSGQYPDCVSCSDGK